MQDTTFGKAVDLALGVAIPVHSHIAINSVLSDYVPKSVLGKCYSPTPNFLHKSTLLIPASLQARDRQL